MAKLYLKFEQTVLKEFTLSHGVITIGRLPDNLVQIDNPAVSGHHARIYWDTDHYVVEDNESTNGTYINNHRVSKATLNDGDLVLIGKHGIQFKDEWHEDTEPEKTVVNAPAPMAKLEGTVMLDTKKARELLAQAQAISASGKMGAVGAAPAAAARPVSGAHPAPPPATAVPAAPAKEKVGHITILAGNSDQQQYVLTGRLTAIGKSDMATIRLKGWFKPKLAATISRRDNKYFIAASEPKIKVIVNGAAVSGQRELGDADIVEVAGLKMSFTLGV
jgi:predicted component of type VI protein secretion system